MQQQVRQVSSEYLHHLEKEAGKRAKATDARAGLSIDNSKPEATQTLTQTDFTTHNPYTMSKILLSSQVKVLAQKIRHLKLKVAINVIHPGWVQTRITKGKGKLLPEQATWLPCMLLLNPPSMNALGLYSLTEW